MEMSSARGDRGLIQVSKSKALVLLVCDRSHDPIDIPYEMSWTSRSQDANLSYSDDTDMKNNDSYAPLPTPSGSTGGPGRIHMLPPVLSESSAADLDSENPYAIPPGRHDDPMPLPDLSGHPIPGGPGGNPWKLENLSKSDATS